MNRVFWITSLVCMFVVGYSINDVSVKGQTSTPTFESEISVGGGTSYGSTGIYARTFTSVNATIGSDITYTSDSVNGDYFTINHPGLYSISYTDGNVHPDSGGISINLSATSVFSSGWGTGNELCGFSMSNNAASCSADVLLSSGDVLRAHSSNGGTPPNSQTISKFIVTRIR